MATLREGSVIAAGRRLYREPWIYPATEGDLASWSAPFLCDPCVLPLRPLRYHHPSPAPRTAKNGEAKKTSAAKKTAKPKPAKPPPNFFSTNRLRCVTSRSATAFVVATTINRSGGRVARQRSAKPRTAVRIRSRPHLFTKPRSDLPQRGFVFELLTWLSTSAQRNALDNDERPTYLAMIT